MADSPEAYRTRAAVERANADAATLDNVRDRCLRAEQAWTAMADRAERTTEQRLIREAATAKRTDPATAN
ncbi:MULTISPECIES: hypothetical protein [unclassified Sphingomonas]|uniref:hypothetical protein n=1 Tax=unclassified Sphingomonas TaxID=196159 RepID=UPI0006F5FC8E|nr:MULTISPECIES: hypothetical protein [unclassified Sphingomonas]KQM98335.1 hypothetical protein ASE78_08865 [Sphingomonas sp. Leaf25]KQN37469.1 hypothetical protein ASE97_07795 [Sphingomonas sp. Leaf42]KQT27837.1 hypothetical protein ASG37_10505 [Sphingomonas sp. Leaf407]